MSENNYKTREEILRHAQEVLHIPLGKIDKTGRLSTGKGAIGTVIEESWFGYTPNSNAEPDFPEAKVEMKVAPYIINNKGEIRAKERLVCNIINYMTEYKRSFYTSDFWHKCETMLLLSYQHKPNVPKAEFTIDMAILFSFPTEDLVIIEQDWERIISKIRAGQAHLLMEGDTLYLAACTKGATAETVREQPFSNILAKQRAYSLKSTYMTRILNRYIFGKQTDEHIIKDWHELKHKKFESYILDKISPYYGKTQHELRQLLSVHQKAKNINEILLSHMLGVSGRISKTEEFQNANIVPKTIRVQNNGNIKESMSFPPFRFLQIVQETWEDAQIRQYLEPTRFMFVIFRERADGAYIFDDAFFWNIPYQDLEQVKLVWERTKEVINNGVQLVYDGRVTHNNLPKATENPVAHIRPHARDMADTYPLPDGRRMPKQCFWLNRAYIKKIVEENTRRYACN